MQITDHYSSVVINQNAPRTSTYAWRTAGAGWIYQSFAWPGNYQRGSQEYELRVPDLSGFQVLVNIDSGYAINASLDYKAQYYVGDNDGWHTIAHGTIIGATADGDIWFDIILPDSIPIPPENLTVPYRLGLQARTAVGQPTQAVTGGEGAYVVNGQTYDARLTLGMPFSITLPGNIPGFLLKHSDGSVVAYAQEGIGTVSYVSPSPLLANSAAPSQAFQADGVTPLLGANTSSALNFRVLGLAADNGTSILGNTYRSAVTFTAGGTTSTTDGKHPIAGSGASPYYMSPPLPSQFAVTSLYWDMRPAPLTPQIIAVNNIGNPSFEYDIPGHAPQWWSAFHSGGTVVDQTVKSTALVNTDPNFSPWSYDKFQVLHMKYTFGGASQQQGIISGFYAIQNTTGGQPTPLTISLAYDIITASNCSLYLSLLFYDANNTLLSTQNFDPATTGINTFTQSTTVPANAVQIRYLISALSTAAGSFEAYIDAAQVTFTSLALPYFDGDDDGCQWTGQRGQSPSALLAPSTPGDGGVVVDGVMINPATPNIICNVYWSNDDAYDRDHMTERDWEQKIWNHVPRVILATHRQQYMFPAPIQTKYLKLEITNPQAQHYDPGPLHKPMRYKKFPTWVASYFIAQMIIPAFIAGQKVVENDALTFAYSYYLDDLRQSPKSPEVPPADALETLTQYFSPSNADKGVDPTTMNMINLNMNFYNVPIQANTDNSTIGQFVRGLFASSNQIMPTTSVLEGGTIQPFDYSTVSSLNRESVVIEQSMPDMYFFIPCRHTYKETMASFKYHRAYFMGIKDVAWLRHNYTAQSDTPLYIESGGDVFNTQIFDWVIGDDQNWYTY